MPLISSAAPEAAAHRPPPGTTPTSAGWVLVSHWTCFLEGSLLGWLKGKAKGNLCGAMNVLVKYLPDVGNGTSICNQHQSWLILFRESNRLICREIPGSYHQQPGPGKGSEATAQGVARLIQATKLGPTSSEPSRTVTALELLAASEWL